MRICSSTCSGRFCASSMISTALALSGISDEQELVERVDQLLLADAARAARALISSREITPKSWRIRLSRSSSDRNGFSTSAVNVVRSICSSSARHSVVLPVPMSPVTTTKPSRRRMAYCSSSNALACDCAPIEILRIRRQAERLLGEPVVALVHVTAPPRRHDPRRQQNDQLDASFASRRCCGRTSRRVMPTRLRSRDLAIAREAGDRPASRRRPRARACRTRSAAGAFDDRASGSASAPSRPAICGVTLSVSAVGPARSPARCSASTAAGSRQRSPCPARRAAPAAATSVTRSPSATARRAGRRGGRRSSAGSAVQSTPRAFSSFSSTSTTRASICTWRCTRSCTASR